MRKELQHRLIELSKEVDELCKNLDNSFLSEHLTKQIIRSSTSTALNYGEALSAESNRDFSHKVSVVLKELRETKACLTILDKVVLESGLELHQKLLDENDQLIAIFYKTLSTIKRKQK